MSDAQETEELQELDIDELNKLQEREKFKQLIGKTEPELYKKLYDFYFGGNNASLEDLYSQTYPKRQ